MLKAAIIIHVSPVSPRIEVHGSKETYHRVLQTSFWLISYSGELCNENYDHDVDHLKRILL